jgi:hypothetical protein
VGLIRYLKKSSNPDRTVQRRLLLGMSVCAVLLLAGYFGLVSTPWGHHLDNAAYIGRKALKGRVIRLDSDVLDLVSVTALLLAAMVLIGVAMVRRCTLVGVIVVAGFACAVVGAEVLKDTLPWRAIVPGDGSLDAALRRCTYPSGHATIGTSLALSLLLVSSSRWRPWLGVAAGCMSATFATGVLFAGWHRPSDALGALAWSGFCMTVSATIAVRLRGRPRTAIDHPGRALLCLLGAAILVAAATWLVAAGGAPDYPHRDLPFLLLTGLIIAGSFSLIAWFAWQLRAVDWTREEN